MKIIRHTARDMRAAMRGVREQLGEDAVILSSRRTSEGVEITAAADLDASTLEAGGFANTPAAAPQVIEATVAPAPVPRIAAPSAPATAASTARMPPHMNPTVLALTAPRSSKAGKVAATPTLEQLAAGQAASCVAVAPQPAPSYDALASLESLPTCNQSTCEDEWI